MIIAGLSANAIPGLVFLQSSHFGREKSVARYAKGGDEGSDTQGWSQEVNGTTISP